MSVKKKVKKKKRTYYDDDTHENTLASSYIHSDQLRSEKQAIDALPVNDPNSKHFDERKYDKTEYHRQSMDWIDYDTSTTLQEKYNMNVPEEYTKYNVDLAEYDQESRDTAYYHDTAYKQNDPPHIEGRNFKDTINTDQPKSPFSRFPDSMNSTDTNKYEDEELSDAHPSEGGDPRKYIESQINSANADFKQWRDNVDEKNEPPLWNNALADRYEDKQNWWNASSKRVYDMPHQALHGGVDNFDDESDIPLNAYWHKSTVSPDSWHMYVCCILYLLYFLHIILCLME